MSRKLEIGSNFWLSKEEIATREPLGELVYGLEQWENRVLTSSGRGAIRLLFQQLPQVKKVLLPIYTCSSVINPIERLGISCQFYPVNRQLEVDMEALMDRVNKTKPDAVYFQSYYGYDTLLKARSYYKELQKKGIVVVEDITHSWLCDFNTNDADYSIASLRKWLELPDGGVLLSNKHSIEDGRQYGESEEIVSEFIKASEGKERYFQTLDPNDKQEFRQHYVNAKDLLLQNDAPFRLSNLSCSVLAQTDFEKIVRRRRENAAYLRKHLKWEQIEACIPNDDSKATPLYFPIYVKGDRVRLQKELAANNIYCPVHWPIPEHVKSVMDENSNYIYNHVLSLICDQRYGEDDMEAIVNVINNYI